MRPKCQWFLFNPGDDKGRQGAAKDLLQGIAETYANEYNSQAGSDIPELAFFYEVEEV